MPIVVTISQVKLRTDFGAWVWVSPGRLRLSVCVCVHTHTHAETRTDACLCTIAVVKVVAEHHRKSDIYPANTTLNRKPAVTELELNKPARMIACLYTKVSPRRPEGVVLASGHGQKNKLVNWLSLVLWGTPKDMQRAWWAWDEQRCMEN